MGEEYRELEEDLEARTSECVQDFYLGLFRKKILRVDRDKKAEKRIEKHLNDLLLHVFYFAISALLFVTVTCAK
jgi:TPP-dependent pyruvate/acetoin dehydrogenase alpha subunit